MKTLALFFAVPAIVGLSACTSKEGSTSAMKANAPAAMAPAGSVYYMEERHEGRIYVFGDAGVP